MSESPSAEERLRKLEELFSHQEHVLEQLNEIVLQLRLELESLHRKFEARLDRLEARVEQSSLPLDPNEKPPHY